MIIETGRIMSIEAGGVWVETIQKTACGSCKAEQGCGQRLLSKWDGHSSYIWVLFDGGDPADYHLGDEIQIGIPEEVIAQGSLIIYMIPILALVISTSISHIQFANEAVTILSGFAGLLLGGILVRWHSWRNRYNRGWQPVLVDDRKPLHFYQLDGHHHAAN